MPIEEWSVCLPDHHPGYVTWEEYLATRERLRANVRPRGEGGGAAREGGALLQGLLRCGRCGRRMQVAYSGSGRPLARATRASAGFTSTAPSTTCQSLGGGRLDKAVADAFLDAVTPAGVARDRRRDRRARAEQHEQRLAGQRLAVERAEFEAERARAAVRRVRAGEPARRAHARAQARGQALSELEREQRTLAALERARPAPLSRPEREALARLARDLPRLWDAPRRPPTATARSCCAR